MSGKQSEEFKPCPFCGCATVRETEWWGDDGEIPALECTDCLATALKAEWNRRTDAAQATTGACEK